MGVRSASLFFSFLGLLSLIIVLILTLARGVPVFLGEERLKSHGLWTAFVVSVVITGALGAMSLITGLGLRRASKFGGYLGIVTSGTTTIIGLIGTFTDVIPVLAQIGSRYQFFRYFYIILLLIGLLMWVLMATSWKDTTQEA